MADQSANRAHDIYRSIIENSFSNPDLALRLGEELTRSKSVDVKVIAEVKSEMAYALFSKAEYVRSLTMAQEAMAFARENHVKTALARAHNVIGNNYYAFSAFDIALEHYLEAERIFESENDSVRLNGIYNNIANIFVDTKNFAKAEEYYTKSLEYGIRSNNSSVLGAANFGLGNIYAETGDFDKAKRAYNESLRFYELDVASADLSMIYGALADLSQRQKKFDEALVWSEKRIQLLEGDTTKLWKAVAYANHAKILAETAQFGNAEHFIARAESFVPPGDALSNGPISLAKIRLAEKRGNFEDAVRHLWSYTDHVKARYSSEAASRVSILEAAFQSERKQREIEALTADNKIKQFEVVRQRYLWLMTLGVVIVTIVLAIFLFHRWRSNVLLNEQKQLNQKLKELDRLKDRILANTSHELRTPLNGIVGLSELLLASPLARDEKEHVQMIADCGRRLATVVDDLLNFAAIKEQSVEGKPVPFQLADITKGVLAVTSAAYVREGLTVENHLPDKLPLVFAEPHRVQQVLTNLLSNALKFTEKGRISIDAQVFNGFVKICVSDTGIGIAKDKLDSVFDAFTQVDNSSTRGYHGVGLGLTIVKELVQRFGGEVGVESEVNVGSVFWFTLPIYSWNQEKASSAVGAKMPLSQLA